MILGIMKIINGREELKKLEYYTEHQMHLGEDRRFNHVSMVASYFDKFHGVRNINLSSSNSKI